MKWLAQVESEMVERFRGCLASRRISEYFVQRTAQRTHAASAAGETPPSGRERSRSAPAEVLSPLVHSERLVSLAQDASFAAKATARPPALNLRLALR